MSTTLKQANDALDAFNLTLSEDNEDTPETLAEQLKLIDAVTAAEAADLPSLSTKQLVAHWNNRAPEHLTAWKGSKAALIAKIEALPPLTPEPTPPAAEPESFSVAAYALSHGLDARELRKKLRASGLRAPHTLEQVEKVVGA
jgi:cell division septation protein DedD